VVTIGTSAHDAQKQIQLRGCESADQLDHCGGGYGVAANGDKDANGR
jgi:hypothetical protein